jgi:hypothetical protein
MTPEVLSNSLLSKAVLELKCEVEKEVELEKL